jgi:tripartite-type tricarboxylate transporter receptor subunit TctC
VIGRIIAERMRATLGQPVIVENVTGANGSIGAGRVARAAPDGYTFVIGAWGTHVTNGALYSLSYDTVNDFQPIALVTSQPYLIVTRKTLPADDLSGVIAWLKANPDKASAGIAGVGNASHVSAIFLQKATDTRFQFVPYRGGAPALQDLVGGQIDLMMAALGDCAELVRAGTIRARTVAARIAHQPCPMYQLWTGRIAWVLFLPVAWALGAEGHPERHNREAQRRRSRCLG